MWERDGGVVVVLHDVVCFGSGCSVVWWCWCGGGGVGVVVVL